MLNHIYHYGALVLALAAVFWLTNSVTHLWVHFQMWAILKPSKIVVTGGLMTAPAICVTYLAWFFLIRP